jgi:hypothetical protein
MQSTVSNWSPPAQDHFTTLRRIVWTVAERAEIGGLEEALKWGQPAWLPQRRNIGTTLRCNWQAAQPDRFSLFVPCSTSLVETIKTLYPKSFTFEGQRGLHLTLDHPLPLDVVDHCAFLTLTYHRKRA